MTEEDAPTTTPSTENGPEIYKVKVDHFEGIYMLGEENIFEGAPNFRQVSENISNYSSISKRIRLLGSQFSAVLSPQPKVSEKFWKKCPRVLLRRQPRLSGST